MKIKDIKNNFENGKKFSTKAYDINSFMVVFEKIITSHNNTTNIIKDIKNTINKELEIKTTLLKPYNEETPLNRLAYWGALFDSLLNFFLNNISHYVLPEYKEKYIHPSKYKDIPKRFRSAIKKRNGGYVVATDIKGPKYHMILKKEFETSFNTIVQEAKQLIPLIYKKEIIGETLDGYDTFKCGNHTIKHPRLQIISGAKPATLLEQRFISDEQMKAHKRLFEIFTIIISMFDYIEYKSNAAEIYKEYEKYTKTNKKGYVAQAQSFDRTATQFLVSMKRAKDFFDKKDISRAELALQQQRENLLQNLKSKISTKIK